MLAREEYICVTVFLQTYFWLCAPSEQMYNIAVGELSQMESGFYAKSLFVLAILGYMPSGPTGLFI